MPLIFIEEKNGGLYRAAFSDGELIVRSRQPFFDGARELLRRGIDPNTVLIMVRRSKWHGEPPREAGRGGQAHGCREGAVLYCLETVPAL